METDISLTCLKDQAVVLITIQKDPPTRSSPTYLLVVFCQKHVTQFRHFTD
jgi:hypothetical protein